MTEVKMDLTDQDIENVNHLEDKWQESNKADVVSDALSLAVGLTKLINKGDAVIVKHKNGSVGQLDIPGINNELEA